MTFEQWWEQIKVTIPKQQREIDKILARTAWRAGFKEGGKDGYKQGLSDGQDYSYGGTHRHPLDMD